MATRFLRIAYRPTGPGPHSEHIDHQRHVPPSFSKPGQRWQRLRGSTLTLTLTLTLNQDNDGNVSEADTAEIEDGAGDVAAGDVTAGLDDSVLGGGGDGGGEDGGRYDNGGGDGAGDGGDENMLDITGPMEPAMMVPQVGECACQ